MEEERSKGFSSIHPKRQKKNDPAVYETLIGKQIEVLISFDINKENTETAQRWCCGAVERICDGT